MPMMSEEYKIIMEKVNSEEDLNRLLMEIVKDFQAKMEYRQEVK